MADMNNKPKLQLRSGLSFNGEKTPPPAQKLLINHGKPNFTIQRSPKIMNGNGIENGNGNPWPTTVRPTATPAAIKSNEFVVKSTTYNGVLKPSSISKASLQLNTQEDNEMSKVVLRRTKVHHEPPLKPDEDENVPEFIRRQRRIQERLAKENVLDFENRRSGYFTQVMISPTSPNRQSFAETMSSPAIVPGLEIPPPSPVATQREVDIPETSEEESKHEETFKEVRSESLVTASPPIAALNGHGDEDEVNRAIEEVNKAVAGEDDDKAYVEEFQHEEITKSQVSSYENVEHTIRKEICVESTTVESSTTMQSTIQETTVNTQSHVKETSTALQNGSHEADVVSSNIQTEEITSVHMPKKEEEANQPQLNVNGHAKVDATQADATQAFLNSERADSLMNSLARESTSNGKDSNGHDDEITICHTNSSSNAPCIPSPDPSGEKGVNYEPKTVVSFSQEMGSDVNKYPDTVMVTKDVNVMAADGNDDLKEMAKLKFDIKSDQEEFKVTSVLKTD